MILWTLGIRHKLVHFKLPNLLITLHEIRCFLGFKIVYDIFVVKYQFEFIIIVIDLNKFPIIDLNLKQLKPKEKT